MADRPILFNAEMVRAILDGRKTQTRRPVRPQRRLMQALAGSRWESSDDGGFDCDVIEHKSPFGQPNDLLYVRETFYVDHFEYPKISDTEARRLVDYRADHDCTHWEAGCPCRDDQGRGSWVPSIHMPKRLARIWLRVGRVWVERVQDIRDLGAIAEGWDGTKMHDPSGITTGDQVRVFAALWDSIYAKQGLGWDDNPWVWCCEFERVNANG